MNAGNGSTLAAQAAPRKRGAALPGAAVPGSVGLGALVGAGLVGLFLWCLSFSRTVDLDAFHLMALFRRALQEGHLPLQDAFAYTPTVFPVVQHEWGTGAALWAVWEGTGWGAAGLSALRYGLVAVLLILGWALARRRGASALAIAVTAPLALLLLVSGLSPVRGQLFTFVLLTALLWFLELDRRGARWWIAPWFLLSLAWVNLHAGYVVGLGAVAITLADRVWAAGGARAGRGEVRRLGLVLAGMAALLFLTPYGAEYPRYLLRALTMPRPLIPEWWPAWAPSRDDVVPVELFALSLLPVAYALWRSGVRPGSGFPLLVVLAIASLLSVRHLPLYAIAFLAWTASAFTSTELVALVEGWWARRRIAVATVCVLCACMGAWQTVRSRAWELTVAEHDPGGRAGFPVRAIDHLAGCGFSGNLLTPFAAGAYVSWRLAPRVKVSLDGRYEVAYPPGLLEEHLRFFDARPGWRDFLDRYATDALLVPRSAPVAAALDGSAPLRLAWPRAYLDTTYAIYLRRASPSACMGTATRTSGLAR